MAKKSEGSYLQSCVRNGEFYFRTQEDQFSFTCILSNPFKNIAKETILLRW